MLLTKKSEYALLSLVSIANSSEPKNADTLSKEFNISRSFLAKILQSLSKADILKSYKGANGGFCLNMQLDQITISQIAICVEDRTPRVFECSIKQTDCPNHRAMSCAIWPILNTLQSKIDGFLEELTLQDLINDIDLFKAN
jgi:Rrf2 family protein